MKYRKKPVEVEADVYQQGMEDGFDTQDTGYFESWKPGVGEEFIKTGEILVPYIKTLEGKHYISKGDYIITGVKGERYPCKPDIFKMTYELVGD